jgi:peptidoglycan/LPS O-acetylase OafA/YrhL
MARDVGTEAVREHRSLGHVPGLDGIRGFALTIVLITHGVALFWTSQWFHVFAGGFIGMEMFFVLSGFLITSLLLGEHHRSGRIGVGRFYQRRALRLLPALAALIVGHLIWARISGLDAGTERHSIIAIVVYGTNWFEVAGHPVALGLAHLWSLAVEEQFYAIWPLVTLLAVSRPQWRRRAPAVIGIVVVVLAIETSITWGSGYNFATINRFYPRTDVQAVALLLGSAAAYLWTGGMRMPRHLPAIATVCAVVIAVCTFRYTNFNPLFYRWFGNTWISFAACVCLLAVIDGRWFLTRFFGLMPLRWLGRVSYSIYLWHWVVYVGVYDHLRDDLPDAVQAVLAVSLTFALGLLSFYFVERPFLRRKDLMTKRRREAEAARAGVVATLPRSAVLEPAPALEVTPERAVP